MDEKSESMLVSIEDDRLPRGELPCMLLKLVMSRGCSVEVSVVSGKGGTGGRLLSGREEVECDAGKAVLW